MRLRLFCIITATWAAATLTTPSAQAQSLLADLDAVDTACPPGAFTTMSALVTCQYRAQRPIWLRYAPEAIAAYDDSVRKRLANADAFDARRITADQTMERFQEIQLEFVVAAKAAQVAKLQQTLRQEETREQERRLVRGLADAVKAYGETRQQGTPVPRPPVITNCVTTGAFTNCTSQ